MPFLAAFFATALFAAALCPAVKAEFHWDTRDDDNATQDASSACPLWDVACQTSRNSFHNWNDDCQWWQWFCKAESPPDVDTSTGQCRAFGDPHYVTFDDAWLDFQGDCTYTLAETCKDIDYEPFKIRVSTKKARAPDTVSYVRSVYVEVYGHQVDLTYEEGIVVNGTSVGLPAYIDGGKITVNGLFWMELVTDFGMTVRYNRAKLSAVEISLPGRYKNALCGLCGNWNDDPADDKIPRNNDTAATDHEVGDSWLSPQNPDLYCNHVTPDPGECSAAELASSSTACAAISTSEVLGRCRDAIAQDMVDHFVDACKFDACKSGNAQTALCDVVTSLVDYCYSYVDTIVDWRRELECWIKCPKHSTYNPGIRRCPDSCWGNSSHDCSPFPVEGCQCDHGYVMSGSNCIPRSECGCLVEVEQTMFYHELGDMWLSNDCLVHHTCREGGVIEDADVDPCGENGQCRIQAGLRGCYCDEGFIGDGYNCYDTAACECSGTGGLHYHTCDSEWLHVQGDCTYTLMKTDSSAADLEAFTVDVSTKRLHSSDVMTQVRDVYIYVYDYKILLSYEYGPIVNGMLLSQPVVLEDGAITISGFNWTKVNLDFGLAVTYSRNENGAVYVHLPTTYRGHIGGICGNWNGDRADDLFPKDQSEAGSQAEVVDSWISERNEDRTCSRKTPEARNCTEEQRTAAEQTCLKIVEVPVLEGCRNAIGLGQAQAFVDNCISDICWGGNATVALCEATANMAISCNLKLTDPVDWRDTVGCAMTCPANSHYSSAITQCPPSCGNPTPSKQCFERPTEGCICDLGFVTSGDSCVLLEDCGCTVIIQETGDTVYQELGNVWVSRDCSNKFTCDPDPADPTRAPSTAPMDPCDVHGSCRDGYRGQDCYCDEGYSGNGHVCWDSTKCQCSVSGSAHYRTFDSARIHFPGDCTYALAKTSEDKPEDLIAFEVDVDAIRTTFNASGSFVRAAYVTVYEQRIEFSHDLRIQVNGVPVSTPSTLVNGSIWLRGMADWVELVTDFHLVLRFKTSRSMQGVVELSVPRRYSQHMEGLCGDCDTDPGNDLVPKGRTDPTTPMEFGDSWVVENQADQNCSMRTRQLGANCNADVRKVSACAQLKTHPVLDACRIVIGEDKLKKYFEECLLDACVGDSHSAVCDIAKAMVFDCNINMTEPVDWRDDLDCPFTCPADSVYSHNIRDCQPSCVAKLAEGVCFDQPIEGCVCNDDFLRSGETCVQPGNCGCEDHRNPQHDLYYMDETSFSEVGCRMQYLCRNFSLQTSTNCSEHATCEFRDGVRDCYCFEGYEGDGYICTGECDVDHCAECAPGNRSVCEVCEDDFPKNALNQKCEAPCNASNCDICVPGNTSLCHTCSVGHSVNAISGQCEEFCTVARCAICVPGNSSFCHTCSGILAVNHTGQCEDQCNVINCIRCPSDDPTRCEECDRDFSVNAEGQCRRDCEVPFCARCVADEHRKCEDCVQDYMLSEEGYCLGEYAEACEVPFCEACAESDNRKCVDCVSTYNLTADGHCVGDYSEPCEVPFCAKCDPNDNRKCLDCVLNYGVSGTGQCVGDYTDNCEVPFCGNCSQADLHTCIHCVGDYDLADGRCYGNYSECNVAHCQQCEDGSSEVCAQCMAERVLNEDGNCVLECSVPGCLKCRENDDEYCVECKEAKFLTENGTCNSCDVGGCLRCVGDNPTKCELCRADLVLTEAGQCDTCRVENCASCSDDDADLCDRCKNYYTLTEARQCEDCTVEHCEACEEGNSDRCARCLGDRSADENGQCTLSCVVPGCVTCKEGNPNVCVECEDIEDLTQEGTCENCNVVSCLECVKDDPEKCKICRAELILNENGGCDKCAVENCASCSDDYVDRCDRCKRYYDLTATKKCEIPCDVDRCELCQLGNTHKCVTCIEGLVLALNDSECKYPCNVPNCDYCLPGDPRWCNNCTGDMVVTAQGMCKEPCFVPKCISCDPDDPNFCQDCEDKLVITSEGQCRYPCHVDRCIDCKPGNTSLCINCTEGLILAGNGTCREPCYVNHCDRCNDTDPDFCLFCGDDMVAYEDGTCKEPCNVTDCVDCQQGNVSRCINCIPGRVVARNATCREPCNVAHCDRCNDTDPETCRFCGDNMVVYEDGSCKEPCNVSHCIDCQHGDVLQCINCEPGLVVADNGTCREPCNLAHCSRCMTNDPNICVTCVDDLVVGHNGTCVEPCYIDNCLRCESGKPKECAICDRDLEVSPNGTCQEPCRIANCTECDAKDSMRCLKCDGQLIVADNGTCVVPCNVDDCVRCVRGDPNKCQECDGDLVVSVNGTCKEPCQVDRCIQCEEDSPVRCAKCQGNLVVSQDGQCQEPCEVERCRMCEDGEPKICLVCDEGLEVATDGQCQERCSVEQCETCQTQNRSRCAVCKGDLIVKPDFTCGEQCRVPNCLSCEEDDAHKCSKCKGDRHITNNASTCAVPCLVEDCQQCVEGLRNSCLKCNPPLVVENGTCVEMCNVAKCLKCVEGNPEECAVCDLPLIVGEEGDCLQNCTVANCETCEDNDPDRCKECLGDLVVRLDGRCDGACNVPYCLTCLFGIPNECSTCALGFELDLNLACEAECVVPHCAKCSEDDGFTCMTCDVGYDLEDNLCKSGCLIKHCKKCYDGDIGQCHHCEEDYYRNPGGLCLAMAPPENVPLVNNKPVEDNPLANTTLSEEELLEVEEEEEEEVPVIEHPVVVDSLLAESIDANLTANASSTPVEATPEATPEVVTLGETREVRTTQRPTGTTLEHTPGRPITGTPAMATQQEAPEVATVDDTPRVATVEMPAETEMLVDAPYASRETAPQLCWDPNCISCNQFNRSFCDNCADDYALLKGECVVTKPNCGELCVDCRAIPTDFDHCFECTSDYVAVDGRCVEKLPECDQYCTNCTWRSESAWCVACVEGYKPQNGTCGEFCQPSNCQTCVEHDYDTCKVCNEGYDLTEAGECKAECEPAHCLMCPDPDVCSHCERGYHVTQNGTCILECSVLHCTQCEEGTSDRCQSCDNSYEVDDAAHCRGACHVPHCAECVAGDADTCYRCEDGYLKSQTGACIMADEGCWDNNCIKCANRKLCDQDYCMVGYEEVEGECIETRNLCVENCADCYNSNTTGHICLSCKYGYAIQNEACEASCDLDHCLVCENDNIDRCKTCAGGFTLVHGSCTEGALSGCSSDCLACTPGDELQQTLPLCKDCPVGKTPIENRCQYVTTTTCRAAHCTTCRENDRLYCMQCEEGYAMGGDGGCIELRTANQHQVNGTLDLCWDSHCVTCEDEGHVCVTCEDTFELVEGECIKTAAAPDCGHLCMPDNCTATDDGPWCLKCVQGYQAREGHCYVRLQCEVAHCSRCEENDNRDCHTCSAGYIPDDQGIGCRVFVPPTTTPPPATTVFNCKVLNCQTCGDNNDTKCDTCVEGYEVDDDFACSEISSVRCGEECIRCLVGDTCVSCMEGYGLNELGMCVQMDLNCWDPGCMKCAHRRYCESCLLGYHLQEEECIFTIVDDCGEDCENCIQDDSRFWCTRCAAGFTPIGSQCIACEFEHCLECLVVSANGTMCNLCAEGFDLAEDKLSCIANSGSARRRRRREVTGKDEVVVFDVSSLICHDPRCEWCPEEYFVCEKCQRGYHLVDGLCQDDRTPCDNVETCHDNATCSDGFCECDANLCGDGVNACRDRCICRLEGDPEILTYDRQVILLTGTHKYTLSKDMVNASDPCSFNVEIKVSPLVRQQRVQYATTMPRFLDIEILGYNIHLGQNHKAFVAEVEVDVSEGPYNGDGFVIREQRDPNDPSEDFIVLESKKCGIVIGFYGNDLRSVAIVDVPCKYGGSGRLIGLCGDCDGRSNDLRTLDGTDVSGRPNMFAEISSSYIVDETTDHEKEVAEGIL